MRVREVITNAKSGETSERWSDLPCMTPEEAAAADMILRSDEAREERNQRLAACDWTVLPDAPLDAAQQAEWAAYRQALRDVPDQPGFPDKIAWPEPAGSRALLPEVS